MSTAPSKSPRASTESSDSENTTLFSLDSSRIKRKHHKERRLFRIRDRLDRLRQGQACFSPVVLQLRDAENRYHCENGPAVKWEDGERCYFLEGVRFEYEVWKALVENTLSPKDAMGLMNLSQRRYAIKKIGYAECVKALGFIEIAREGTYAILTGQLDDDRGFAAKILQVKCPSTGFDYFLRIPPAPAMTIHQAIAWTFGFESWGLEVPDYHPEVET